MKEYKRKLGKKCEKKRLKPKKETSKN